MKARLLLPVAALALAAAAPAGTVQTTHGAVICPSVQALVDVYRVADDPDTSTLSALIEAGHCELLQPGARLGMVEAGPAVSRVLYTKWTSRAVYFARSIDLEAGR